MKKKMFVLFLACAFLLNGFSIVFAANSEIKEETSAQQNTASLVSLLPASDGVVTLNMRRLVSEGIPQILSSNQSVLNEILGKIDEVKSKTGLDLRQFEQIAVGISSSRKVSTDNMTFEPIVLARGTFNAPALLALAKIGANGKYREEKIGARTVYVFSVKQAVPSNKPKTNPNASLSEKIIDNVFQSLPDELAVASFDNNTLAIGSTARLRETFDGKTHVGAEVLSLVNRKSNAIMSFGAKLPHGLSPFVNMDNDEIGKTLEAVRQISGSADVGSGNAIVSLTAKMVDVAQAKNLQDTLQGLQMVGKGLIGGGKGANKQVYARMIDNAKISLNGSEVMLDLQVAQSDIDILVSAK